jgi:hypothetical protein
MSLYDLIRKKKDNFNNLVISKDIAKRNLMTSVDSSRSSRKSSRSRTRRSFDWN